MSKISKKALINQIKQETNHIEVPDLTNQIHQKIITDITYEKPQVEEKVYAKSHFKLSFSLVSAFVVILVIAIALPIVFTSSKNTPPTISHAKEVFMVQATSLFNLATDATKNTKELKLNSILLDSDEDDDEENEDENENKNNPILDYEKLTDEILNYLDTVEDFFNKDNSDYELEVLTEGEYKYKMMVSLNIGPLNSIYTMYFNETKKNQDDDEDDLDEISSIILGYITDGETKYNIKGEKEIENDECEVELILYLNSTNTDYIKVNQETESRENEYSYDFYQDNILIREIELELEEKQNKKTIFLSAKDHEHKLEEEYEFTYLEDYIEVSLEKNEVELDIKIIILADKYILDFGNDVKIEREKIKNIKNTNNPNKTKYLIVL